MNRQFTITIDGMQARLQSRTRAAQHEVAAGQVLLQVGAASLNYRALLTLQGALARIFHQSTDQSPDAGPSGTWQAGSGQIAR